MALASITEWEKAAKAAGLKLVDEPELGRCPRTEGLTTRRQWDMHREYCDCCDGSGFSITLTCPANSEEFKVGEMAWVLVAGRTVSAHSQVACELCGDRPRATGSDCCPVCLESAPTMRGAELGVAL